MPAITILSATYADRRHILSETLPLWEKLPCVQKIIMIDNGSHYSVADFVKNGEYKKTTVHHFPENMGSAGAYSKAMELALADPDTEYCIILDDDNVITEETLERIVHHHRDLESKNREKPIACLSVRMNMSVMLENFSHIKNLPALSLRSSTFCGVDIFSMVGGFFSRKDPATYAHPEIELLFGTYGGTFFHKKLIEQIGIPRPELFLYADDPEWSMRIFRAGGKIVLYTDATIDDIDDSWWVNRDADGKLVRKRANPLWQGSDFRIFYGIRGLAWLEHTFFVKNPLRYCANQCVVIAGLAILAIFTGRWRRYRVILHAIHDGKKEFFDNTLYRDE